MAKFSDILSRASSSLWTYLGSDDQNQSQSTSTTFKPRSFSSWSVGTAASTLTSYYGRQGIHSERCDKTFIEGEIIYSKNNICVHSSDGNHVPGYFTIKVHKILPFSEDGDFSEEATLILTWLPNNYIQAHPKSISPDASPSKTVTRADVDHSTVESDVIANSDSYSARKNSAPLVDCNDFVVSAIRRVSITESGATLEAKEESTDSGDAKKGYSSLTRTVTSQETMDGRENENRAEHYSPASDEKRANEPVAIEESANGKEKIGDRSDTARRSKKHKKGNRKTCSLSDESTVATMNDKKFNEAKSGSAITRATSSTSTNANTSTVRASASTVKPMDLFSVDLRQMKSLRLFFSENESMDQLKQQYNVIKEDPSDSDGSTSTGSLVISARDGKFKVFHFHYGGLDKLVSVLEEWQFLKKKQKNPPNSAGISLHTPPLRSLTSPFPLPGSAERTVPRERLSSDSSTCGVHHFTVWRPPMLKQEECHIEEGIYSELDEETWRRRILDAEGRIVCQFKLKRIIFFGGVSPSLRKTVWPFLLKRFSCDSTHDERMRQIVFDRKRYEEIDFKRKSMSAEEADSFWKRIECTVEKDAPRTDRTNPFFAGENNENVHIMKRILLNYAFYNPQIGYTQGMSDLLAPLLIHLKDESEAFWSFVGLMEKTSFISSPKDSDMDYNLSLLRGLLNLMHPKFYKHLSSLTDGLELLFTHRWILLCFKREFPDSAAFKIWEAAWSSYQTAHFHLFVALAIICIYGNEVVEQDMKEDEILFYFSTLTLHMDGEMVLKKSRGLLYQLQCLQEIPCTLEDLVYKDTNLPVNQTVIHSLTCHHGQRGTSDLSNPTLALNQVTDDDILAQTTIGPPKMPGQGTLSDSDSFISIPTSNTLRSSSISSDTTVV